MIELQKDDSWVVLLRRCCDCKRQVVDFVYLSSVNQEEEKERLQRAVELFEWTLMQCEKSKAEEPAFLIGVHLRCSQKKLEQKHYQDFTNIMKMC